MGKIVRETHNIFRIESLWEADEDGDYMPIGDISIALWDRDENNDIMPSEPPILVVEDEEWELDEDGDIMPKI